MGMVETQNLMYCKTQFCMGIGMEGHCDRRLFTACLSASSLNKLKQKIQAAYLRGAVHVVGDQLLEERVLREPSPTARREGNEREQSPDEEGQYI